MSVMTGRKGPALIKMPLASSASNLLLDRLSSSLSTSLLALGQMVPMHLSETVCEAGALTRHICFPFEGFTTLVTQTPGHPDVEVGMVGREGLIGAHVVLGVLKNPIRTVVQGAGFMMQIPLRSFLPLLAASQELHDVLQRYLYVQQAQVTRSTGCKCFHQVEPRLARWLLMCQDRAQSASFDASHASLAAQLGVRRASVTLGATNLKQAGLIDYHRGEMHVIHRKGLAEVACTCYAADNDAYTSMFPVAKSARRRDSVIPLRKEPQL